MGLTILGIPVSVQFEGQGGCWSVEGSAGDQSLTFHPSKGRITDYDAWEIRNEFLDIVSEDQALAFLQKYGLFAKPEPGIPVEGQREADPTPQAGIYGLADVMEWNRILRLLLKTPPAKWGLATTHDEAFGLETSVPDALGFRITFGGLLDTLPPLKSSTIARYRQFQMWFRWEQWRQGKHKKPITTHAAVIKTYDVLGALLATVYVDHLRGAKVGFCARKDCRKPFEITSNHKRQYCCPYCAHLADVRRGRTKSKKRRSARKRTS